jgi:TolB-like protein/cytochrome c-type biogenesis protein CcmH/NrfG
MVEEGHFGDFVFDAARAELRGPGGAVVALRPKTRALLGFLISRSGRVVSREAILEAVWPDVTVGHESVDQAVSELRRALGAEGARLIRTVPRAGYMLDAPFATGLGTEQPGISPVPDGPVLAVLPFEFLGDAEDARWLADGIADDLITALGRWGWFPVIARQSSFAWRSTPAAAERIATALGARYLVEGGVWRLGRRLRVTLRLVEGESGQQLWTGGAEWPVARLFEAEAELLAGLAGPLEAELARLEAARAAALETPGDLDAYLLLQRARWEHGRGGPGHAAEARRLLREAIALDPGYAEAWAFLARATAIAAEMGWTNGVRRDGFAEAFDLAREAARLAPSSGESWYALGEAHLLAEVGWEECLGAFNEALARNPSHVAARARLTTPLACLGRAAEAVRAADLAMRLSPRDPRTFIWLSGLAVAHHLSGDDEAAVAAARRSLLLRPGWAPVHHPLAVSMARLGRLDEAAAVFAQLRHLEPDAMERTEHFARGFRDAEAGRRWVAAMRLAAAA